jgi:multiple antibiotic resistance protein
VVIQAAKSILLVVRALFPIVDPIGAAPVFLSRTRNYDRETQRHLARRITVNSFVLLVASFTLGSLWTSRVSRQPRLDALSPRCSCRP